MLVLQHPKLHFFKKIQWSKYMVYIVFVVVLLLFAIILGKDFFNGTNLMNVLRQTGDDFDYGCRRHLCHRSGTN